MNESEVHANNITLSFRNTDWRLERRELWSSCSDVEKKDKSQSLFHIKAIWNLKKKKKDWMEFIWEKCWLEQGRLLGAFVWCCHELNGSGSGLLAPPLALHGPPEELLHVPGHVHGVVQVEVSVCVQDGVAPATGRMFSLKQGSSRITGSLGSTLSRWKQVFIFQTQFHISAEALWRGWQK